MNGATNEWNDASGMRELATVLAMMDHGVRGAAHSSTNFGKQTPLRRFEVS
jgi:hypothetical protein